MTDETSPDPIDDPIKDPVENPPQDDPRLRVLDMIDRGLISAGEGLHLLDALEAGTDQAEESLPELEAPLRIAGDGPETADSGPSGPAKPVERPVPPNFDKWRSWWMLPLWVGVGVTVLGGLLMFSALQASGLGFWFFCAGVPFLLGLAVMVIAWQTRTAHWMHLRIQQKPGEWPQTIAFSFPLPLRFASWIFRRFGHRFKHNVQGMPVTNLDELIQSLDRSATPETPFYINVDDEDGEKVEIFIG